MKVNVIDNNTILDAVVKVRLEQYADRLEAEEMVIHSDGSVTLTCEDGYICERYFPTLQELYKE